MTNFFSNGTWTENLMKNLLTYLGIPMPLSTGKTVEELLEILPKWRKKKAELGYQKDNKGKEINWSKRSASYILDKAFKIDCLMEVKPGEIYGFDFTCNPEDIEKKREEIEELLPAIHLAGISRVCVVYCKIDDNGSAMYSSKRGEQIEEDMWQMLEHIETDILTTYSLDLTH